MAGVTGLKEAGNDALLNTIFCQVRGLVFYAAVCAGYSRVAPVAETVALPKPKLIHMLLIMAILH